MKISVAMKLLTVALISNFCVGIASAGPPSLDELRRNHAEYQSWKQRHDSAIPFFLETTTLEKSTFEARMGIETVGRSLVELAAILGEPAAWCSFMPLHLNVKACVSGASDGGEELTLYFGRKHYQPPAQATPLTFDFNSKYTEDLLSVNLYAKKGPYGTFYYHIDLYAIPTTDGVYIELRASQRFGKVAKRLGKLYLATLGRHKEGFTVSDYDKAGKPRYVKGLRGVVERNVVRYLLAIKVFLKSKALMGTDAFQRRAELWFDETEAYKRQLHELPRQEYLDNVRREYDNQVALQQSS